MIKLKNIHKSFGSKKVLEDVSLEVKEGEVVSLLGPSGCGKTTTLKIIAGLLKPDEGDILIEGKSVLKTPVEKRGAVIVFQDYLLFPHMTIRDNIAFGLKMARVNKKIIENKVENMLELVVLKGHENKYPEELSGGQRQRVALARALAIEPRVLLLDEPFSNLDSKLREDMRDFTLRIQEKLNITTILVTHDKEEALMSSNKIGVIIDGQIRQFASPEDLYKNPKSIEIADFFGEKNYIEGEVKDGVFISHIVNFKTAAKNNARAKAMIRPEDIKIFPPNLDQLRGKIISSKYAGDRVYYRVGVDDTLLKIVGTNTRIYGVGEDVALHINPGNIIIF